MLPESYFLNYVYLYICFDGFMLRDNIYGPIVIQFGMQLYLYARCFYSFKLFILQGKLKFLNNKFNDFDENLADYSISYQL